MFEALRDAFTFVMLLGLLTFVLQEEKALKDKNDPEKKPKAGMVSPERKTRDDISHRIEVALDELIPNNDEITTTGAKLTIVPINFHIPEEKIASMLNKANPESGALIYSWRKVGVYTMSAPAINNSHYLVNTYLEGYQPFQVENVMLPLYALAQRKTYTLDSNQYHKRSEVWQSSRQAFLYPRGDCEDHAIALADWLIEMGEDARVVLGDIDGDGHAWVVLFRNGNEYLLEATKKSGVGVNTPYPLANLHTEYHPEYMFNRESFWVNKGTRFTTDYSGKDWHRNSEYSISSK